MREKTLTTKPFKTNFNQPKQKLFRSVYIVEHRNEYLVIVYLCYHDLQTSITTEFTPKTTKSCLLTCLSLMTWSNLLKANGLNFISSPRRSKLLCRISLGFSSSLVMWSTRCCRRNEKFRLRHAINF